MLVSLTDNCGTNPGWSDWNWSTETASPGVLSVYLRMDPDLFPHFIHRCLLAVTKIYDAQRGTSSVRSRNSFGRTPWFACLNMNLGCKWDNLSFQCFSSCWKCESTSGNMMFSIFLVSYSWIHWYNPLRKFQLMPRMSHSLICVTPRWLTNFVFQIKNFMLHFLLSISLLNISIASIIALFKSFVYLIETPIWKDKLGVLVCVESFQNLFIGWIGVCLICVKLIP